MEHWLPLAAAKRPDRIAIEDRERSLTYAELAEAASGAAVALQHQGVGARSRVALALSAGIDFVVALHACAITGAAVIPIDLRLTEAERAQRMAGVDLVLSAPLDPGAGRVTGESLDADTPLAVMHTSGTTAAPKPVVLSRGNFLASALGSAVALGLAQDERWLCPMPLTHVGGLSIPIRSSIYATGVILHGRFDADAVLEELMDPDRAITLVSLVPTMLARLLDAGLRRPPVLRWALLGGGAIAPALLERAAAARVPVAPTYGMTEACSQIATFGWPLPGVDLRIVEGEVHVRGPIVANDALAEDGWLHTGDLGRRDEHGRLEIIGRVSETIISGGENVAPAEVEATLLEHPAIDDAAAFGRPDPEWGERVVAAVVLRAGQAATAEELRVHCGQQLAAFKVPKAIEFRDHLPRTASGKLLRREL